MGHKKKNSNGFIDKYSAEQVVIEEKRDYGVNVFYINPVVWKDIIAVIDPEHINPVNRHQISSNFDRNCCLKTTLIRKLLKNSFPVLSEVFLPLQPHRL